MDGLDYSYLDPNKFEHYDIKTGPKELRATIAQLHKEFNQFREDMLASITEIQEQNRRLAILEAHAGIVVI